MWRVVGSVVLAAAVVATGQEASGGVDADAVVEDYLALHGLEQPLAAQLRKRLRASTGDARRNAAEWLGRIYARRLESAATVEERREWEERARVLMEEVPDSQMFELRILLSKVHYLYAEGVVERWRVRTASPEEVREAERLLRRVIPVFEEIGAKSGSTVSAYERREGRPAGTSEEEARIRVVLADARRARSLAMYYAGWSNYYLAVVSNAPGPAAQSLLQFGWLLNSTGRPASVERLPRQLLRYEHVARAAMGCALAESFRGNDDTALRWLDAIEESSETHPGVRSQILLRRIDVLAGAKRWADLQLVVRRARGEGSRPLGVLEARLLGVRMLDAAQDPRLREQAREAARSLAETALSDLVTQGEIRHVLDLVETFGTLPIGDRGFIVHYVRGVQAFERAREAHRQGGEPAEEPTREASVVNRYREAIASLDIASMSEDRDRFPGERTNASLLLGYAAYYAGLHELAAQRLEAAHTSAATPGQAEEALWLAGVSLDRAVENGETRLTEQRDRLFTLFLATYPRSERAARLLLRRAGLTSDERGVEILLGIARESELYEAARRQASGMLYRIYRASTEAGREFAGSRFLEVTREVLEFDAVRIREAKGDEAVAAAQGTIARIRQVLDVSLGLAAPDLPRARHALETLDLIAADVGLSLAEIEGEVAYRRLQIALGAGDGAGVESALSALAEVGGEFALAGDRLMYRRATEAWAAGAEDAGRAREVVRHGARLLMHYGSTREALASPSVLSLHSSVAAAAAAVHRAERDEAMRDVALRLDRAILEHATPTRSVLSRFAELSEDAGDVEGALDAWRSLLAGLTPRAEGWFEARYHSLRLLARVDPPRAREAMDQHKALHPSFGPEPWGARLEALDGEIPREGTK